MPQTRAVARKRAKKLGFPSSSVVKGEKGYFIAPRGIHSTAAKKAYAGRRSKGQSKARAARQAWVVEHRSRGD